MALLAAAVCEVDALVADPAEFDAEVDACVALVEALPALVDA